MQTILKYELPIRVEQNQCVKKKDEISATMCPNSETITAKTCGPINYCQISKDDTIREILDKIFPPIVYKDMGTKWIKYVSKKSTTSLEVKNIEVEMERMLKNRCSRKKPICAIRHDVLSDLANETLRQLIVDCPEQGLLFKRVLDHYNTEFYGYETLLRFTEGFIGRRRVAWQHIKAERQQKINHLEKTKKLLEFQVAELKQKADALEKKNQEAKTKRDQTRNEEIKFYKHRGEQLKAQFDTSVLPSS
uniref:Uncharacterized protein n=1 Tax=Trichobilharzia regenti TaxID=157069 RepID=A0AA85K8K0_TRIRE|nr:unnamed protein product [Trichobilharzia regenti]